MTRLKQLSGASGENGWCQSKTWQKTMVPAQQRAERFLEARGRSIYGSPVTAGSVAEFRND